VALLPENVDYTDIDKASLDARIQALVQSAWPTWTDHQRANFANVINELEAWCCDVLSFYQNKQARECFIAWATQRRSMIALGKLVDFAARSATAATVDETFSIPVAAAGDVVFPAGTTVRTGEVTSPIVFQLLEEARILAGNLSVVGTVEHSTSVVDAFVSDGSPNQVFTLTAVPYVDGSATATVGAGTYTQVTDFLGSTASSLHFTLVVDQNSRAKMTFGNGVNGKIPEAGAFSVDYKTGGGADGNVEAGTVVKIDGTYTDVFANPVVVTVTNAAAAAGGEERMSVETMRQLIPASVRTQTRCIAREDYETAALLVPGVGRALMLSPIENGAIPENTGWLYVVPAGGGVPSAAIKAAVLTGITVTRPGPTSFRTLVLDPVYLTVNVYAKLWVRQGYVPASVGTTIRTNLDAWFAPNNADGTPNTLVDFGWNLKDVDGNPSGLLALSDLFDVVRDTRGVLRMGTALADFTLNGSHADLVIDIMQFPAVGTVTLIDGATGLPI